MKLAERHIAARLKEQGYKLTRPRREVIRAIVNRPEHLTPAAIYGQVHRVAPGIGLATVYRTIEILSRLGLICELHTGSGPSYTASRAEQHHHHLICSGCGTVVDFTGHHLDNLEQRLARETGFTIEGHVLEFTGLCRDCQEELT
jgi:Fur family ferric uptake transcriptional regulator